jgi:hypothetical protein
MKNQKIVNNIILKLENKRQTHLSIANRFEKEIETFKTMSDEDINDYCSKLEKKNEKRDKDNLEIDEIFSKYDISLSELDNLDYDNISEDFALKIRKMSQKEQEIVFEILDRE